MKRAACLLLLGLLPADRAHAAALDQLSADGWYTWRVQVAEGSSAGCCIDWSRRDAKQGCDLDSRQYGYMNCAGGVPEGGYVKLYAKIESGRVVRLRAVSPDCPVHAEAGVSDLGAVGIGETSHWLRSLLRGHQDAGMRGNAAAVLAWTGADGSEQAITQAMVADPDREVREESVFALSRLPGERAVDALLAVVEDRQLDHELRKAALFWLVQSESDRAFASVDRLLSDTPAR